MKTLHLSIIAGIIIIATTSIGVFIEKIGENQQQPYAGITINGIKNNYTINDPIIFSVTVEGYGSGCGDVKATITKENDLQYKPLKWNTFSQCVAFTKLHDFRFNALPVNASVNQAGNYTLTALFNDSMTHNHAETGRRISVLSQDNASIQDSGIIHSVANVINTNFTVNYAIKGGTVLGMTYNIPSLSVIASLHAADKGVLTVTLPRKLVDSVLPSGKDDKFYVLIDSMEASYNETGTTATNRTLSIPFSQGISTIEIIGVHLI